MNYRNQIAALLSAVDVVQADAFRWFGEAVPVAATPQRETALIDTLAEHLYQNFYTLGAAARFPRNNTAAAHRSSGWQLQQQLDRVNACRGHVQRDWCLAAIDGEQLRLTRHGLSVRMAAAACRPVAGQQFEPGHMIAVDAPSARPWRSPGYYLVVGDHIAEHDDAAPMVRIYWNVAGEGRARLMQSLSRSLNALRVAFWFKVATAAEPARCDQAVLYLLRRDLTAANAALNGAYRTVRGDLRSPIPALTRRLAAGVAAAEDPGNGESFGSDRCALLAQCIAGPDVKRGDGVAAVETHFARHGIDLDHPYQAAQSQTFDDFAFDSALVAVGGRQVSDNGRPLREQALGCACTIGAELRRSAVWHAGRCSWMGHQLSAACCGGMHDSVAVAPLGADLYSGVAGVGQFLAELASSTDDSGLAATAIAAFRQAGHLMASQRADPGLYTGHLGTALAMLRAADLLGESVLNDAARRCLVRLLEHADAPGGFDLVSGHAGRALGMALCASHTGDERFVVAARHNADALIATAQRSDDGLCWSGDGDGDGEPALLGYAHGTAGAAQALLEVFAITGEPAYRAAAEQAIAYEQACFDPLAGDWPDRRRRGAHADLPVAGRAQFSATWCHGAPGIALTRLRAFELLADTDYRLQADVALHAVEQRLAASLETRVDDFSLCHGAAGSMAVLIEGGHGDATLAAVARKGIDEYLSGHQWPSGLISGTSPSLMLGLAGVGHTYLCLADAHAAPALGLGIGAGHAGDHSASAVCRPGY